MADVPAYQQPYQGLHDAPYAQPQQGTYVGGLLDSVGETASKWLDPSTAWHLATRLNPFGAAYNSYNQAKSLLSGETTPSQFGRSLLDMTPVGSAVDAVNQSGDLGGALGGGDSYRAGRSTADLAKTVLAMALPGRSKGLLEREAFETAAPRGGFISDLSKTSYPTSIDDMTFTRTPNAPMVPPKVISPEQLQGSLLVPAVGDRTMTGHSLTGINDKPLAFPVNLQGGPNFMRGPQQIADPDKAFWASNLSPTRTLANKLATQVETGDPTHLVYTAMGSQSGDFSHMMSDAMRAQLPDAPITQTSKLAFDREMRKVDKAWPGLDSPDLERVLDEKGGLRTQMVKMMALGEWQQKGFPEIASTRAAITEPELLRQPTGSSGYTIARVTDPRVVEDPSVPHGTYPAHLVGGEYAGGFEKPVPRSLLWPDAYAQMHKAGLDPKTQFDYTFGRQLPVQRASQQWLDNIMKYLNQ